MGDENDLSIQILVREMVKMFDYVEGGGGIRTHARICGTIFQIVDLTTCLHEEALQLNPRSHMRNNV